MSKNRIIKYASIFAPIVAIFLGLYFDIKAIPSNIYLRKGEEINLGSIFTVNEYKNTTKVSALYNSKIDDKKTLKLLGLVPVKNININQIPELQVYPGGIPLGIKINTKGLLVVAYSDIRYDDKVIISPAAQSGINIGDLILKINDNVLKSSQELITLVNENGDKPIKITLDRKGEILTKEIAPVKSLVDNKYKIGLWLRDSTAGVGTLTFYDKNSGGFGALGHPITDVDTNNLLTIGNGEIVESSIISVRKGVRGNPGELKGIFVNESTCVGNILSNTECGIFGLANKNLVDESKFKPMKIALRNEIKEGAAQIITTLDENGPQYYDITIEKLLPQDGPGSKSMIIKITDSKLLEKTGGIIQGMSGSPIIQNNKLVGAVTHVLINKPDTGYGIYIEWMIKDSNILSK